MQNCKALSAVRLLNWMAHGNSSGVTVSVTDEGLAGVFKGREIRTFGLERTSLDAHALLYS